MHKLMGSVNLGAQISFINLKAAYLLHYMQLLFSLVYNGLSAWWLIICLLIGFVYAFFFYQRSVVENILLKKVLFALRFFSISFLAILLLSPLFKITKQRLEKPLIIIAQDASKSVILNTAKGFDFLAYRRDFEKLAKLLADDYEVKVLNFGEEVKSDFNFSSSAKETDQSAVLNYINNQFPNRNIGALILSSDGIYNKGANPISLIDDSKYPIYTIALGDTIAKKDLVLQSPNYNQLVYLGNKHQIEISVSAFKAQGLSSVLKVNTNDGQLKQQNIFFEKDDDYQTIKIDLSANKKGIQKINLQLVPLDGELSVENNSQTIYVEVIDGREKVLLLANAPHPDISALKQAIQSNENYEVEVAYADVLPNETKNFDLIIFHDLPSFDAPITQFLAQTKIKNRWFIIGSHTQTKSLNKVQRVVDINTNNQTQDYLSQLNSNFYFFSLSDDTKTYLKGLSPLTAPFGNYDLNGKGQTLLTQKIGNINTSKPLLTFGTEQAVKTAILSGEGLWRWRIENFEQKENFEAFNELISKSVQYLSAKDDKRKFRVSIQKNRFSENESVVINADLYNDAYELVNTPDVAIDINSKKGKKYSFLFSKKGESYELNAGLLPPDEYNYRAKTKLGDQTYWVEGSFLVQEINAELMQTTANHQLLYNISNRTGGEMVEPKKLLELKDLIEKNEKVKTLSFNERSYDPLINLKWVLGLILLLLSLEWFLRKRNGAI